MEAMARPHASFPWTVVVREMAGVVCRILEDTDSAQMEEVLAV